MIKDIQELNFPNYATLSEATVHISDMGEKTISTQLKIAGDIRPDFSYDWELLFQGEKYIMPLRNPHGAKGNESLDSDITLTFQHWAIYQLKRWMFVTMQPIESGTAVADKYVTPIRLNLNDFCTLLGQVLEYYYRGAIVVDLNPEWQYNDEPTEITIRHTKIWNVMTDTLQPLFGVRWEIKSAADNNNSVHGSERYAIRIGYPTTEVDHIFEYGFKGGLLKVERQVQSDEICNMLIGRGGSKNLPYRYFKDTDPNNPSFKADPDWIPELANIYFDRLRGATFRSYIQGWKASRYGGTTTKESAYAPWAWEKGFNDNQFDPVEFVADEITVNPGKDDVYVEILPGYTPAIKKGSSIDMYGPLFNGLDDNDDIFPTIQGVVIDPYGRIDEVIAVEKVETDKVNTSEKVVLLGLPPVKKTEPIASKAYATIRTTTIDFSVRDGHSATVTANHTFVKARDMMFKDCPKYVVLKSHILRVYDSAGKSVPSVNIPAGEYRVNIEFEVQNTYDESLLVTVGCESFDYMDSDNAPKWSDTWDIWVKNIWGTTKQFKETDKQYAERVWNPILGDRDKNEAKVVFSDGMLSASSDYEFTIPKGLIPKYDTSKSLGSVQSHWRITLGKSDADSESIGIFVPSTMRFAEAGDHFFFTGIDLPHDYVKWGEERVDDNKKDVLSEKSNIKPTWVISMDKVRMVKAQYGEAYTLLSQMKVGNSIRLADKRFIGKIGTNAYETLYIKSMTFTYGKNIIPDVEVVLSDHYEVSANPVSLLQGEVSSIQQQLGSISNIEQIIRAVCDKLYLRKDGISDMSMSPTQFLSLLTSKDFQPGIVGGQGWGFYQNEDGLWVIEADKVNARHELQVNNLVVNQIVAQGGKIIESAASMVVTGVIDTDSGYVCYFDQKDGTVANLFHVDDIAMGQVFNPNNVQTRFYKRRVIAIDTDSITLSKTDVLGDGIPVNGDVIVHYGNYTDAKRQYVKVRNVIGGGYERYIEGLDSVDTAGREYYFVGRLDGEYEDRPRWFIGDTENFIEYKNGKLLINGELTIGATLEGGGTIADRFDGIDTSVEEVRDSANSAQDTANEALQKAGDAKDYIDNTLPADIEAINAKLDGVVENWFEPYTPTRTNNPAAAWVRDGEEAKHEGDTFTNTQAFVDNATTPDAGKSWRWVRNEDNGTYDWTPIADSDAVKALLQAANAQDTADQKRRIFVVTPTTPYDVGDLWTKGTAGRTMRCIKSRATGNYDASDWGYADNAADLANDAQQAADKAKEDAAAAQQAADAAKSEAEAAKNRLDQWASDGIISPTEKQSLKDEIARILSDKDEISNGYTKYGLGTPTAFNTAYTDYNDILVTLTAAIPETISIPSDFATKQTAYYTERTNALNVISAKASDIAEHLGYDSYQDLVNNAQSGKTIIKGGYINTELIDAKSIRAEMINADGLVANDITVNGTFLLNFFVVDSMAKLQEIATFSGSNPSTQTSYYNFKDNVNKNIFIKRISNINIVLNMQLCESQDSLFSQFNIIKASDSNVSIEYSFSQGNTCTMPKTILSGYLYNFIKIDTGTWICNQHDISLLMDDVKTKYVKSFRVGVTGGVASINDNVNADDITVKRSAKGRFTITHNIGVYNYSVALTSYSNICIPIVKSRSLSSFVVECYAFDGSGFILFDSGFYVTITSEFNS